MGTGLLSNSNRNEASRCFNSVMSTRRPIDAAVLGQPLLDQDAAAVGQDLLVALAGLIELAEPLRRATLPRGRSLPDNRRVRRRSGSYPPVARRA